MRQVGGVFADSARSEFRTESGALDFVELAEIAPSLIAYGAGDIDLQFHDCHGMSFTTETAQRNSSNRFYLRSFTTRRSSVVKSISYAANKWYSIT